MSPRLRLCSLYRHSCDGQVCATDQMQRSVVVDACGDFQRVAWWVAAEDVYARSANRA